MTRLERVIGQVKAARRMKNHAWIFDDNGNINDNAVIADTLPYLEELKKYEINVNDIWIENFRSKLITSENAHDYYTYNENANCSEDISILWYEIEPHRETIALFYIHLFGDARCGFSEPFVCKFDYPEAMFELNSAYQTKDITNNSVADLHLFSETYYVYIQELNEIQFCFAETEKDVLLEELVEQLIDNIKKVC